MKFFDEIEKYISYALLALIAIIVISATLEVGYVVATTIFEPPGFFIGLHDLFDLFGLFLMVLIGVELMSSVRTYIESHQIHAEIMVLIAITAVTRKVVILDSKDVEPMTLFGIGFLVIALTAGYFLLKRSRDETSAQ
ncbi:MAG: phosphate-starvation-inducible PsiE family protein [Gammaproteobacteria bacterium]|nr:phosphate-starvation-inducible PsiE family protein [Gammaproteobacteria bacterium]